LCPLGQYLCISSYNMKLSILYAIAVCFDFNLNQLIVYKSLQDLLARVRNQ